MMVIALCIFFPIFECPVGFVFLLLFLVSCNDFVAFPDSLEVSNLLQIFTLVSCSMYFSVPVFHMFPSSKCSPLLVPSVLLVFSVVVVKFPHDLNCQLFASISCFILKVLFLLRLP